MHELIATLFAVVYGTLWLRERRCRDRLQISNDFYESILEAANLGRFVVQEDGTRRFTVRVNLVAVKQIFPRELYSAPAGIKPANHDGT